MRPQAALACVAAALVAAVCRPTPGLAAPPPPQVRQAPAPIGTVGPAGGLQVAPDISASAAQVLHFTGGHWAPLPPDVPVPIGPAILLQCQIGVAGLVKANSFNVAWYVDGVKTCGEWFAGLHNAPLCEFTWPTTQGGTTYIAYGVSTPGPHTFKCVADVGNRVSERSEQNNSAQTSFSAYKPATVQQLRRNAPPPALPAGQGIVHP